MAGLGPSAIGDRGQAAVHSCLMLMDHRLQFTTCCNWKVPYVGELLQFELGSCHLSVLVVTAGDTKAGAMPLRNKTGFVEVRGPGVTSLAARFWATNITSSDGLSQCANHFFPFFFFFILHMSIESLLHARHCASSGDTMGVRQTSLLYTVWQGRQTCKQAIAMQCNKYYDYGNTSSVFIE